jgi:hypothetical protein
MLLFWLVTCAKYPCVQNPRRLRYPLGIADKMVLGMLNVTWLLVAEYFLVMVLTGERNLIKEEGCGGWAGLLYGAGGYGWDACLSGGLEGGKSDWTPEKEDVSLRQLNSRC